MDYNRLLFSEISFKPAKLTATTTSQNNNKNNNNTTTTPIRQSNAQANEEQATFQVAKHQLCDPDSIKLEWLQSEKVGGGLINVGNTCFLNSVLQCLTYCPPLYNFLVKSNGGHSNSCKLNQFCMLCEMEKHVKNVKSSNGTSIKPVSIVHRLKYINKSFQFGRQEDAHEFLRYLIDHMWKACLMNHDIGTKSNSSQLSKLDPKIKETTMINHIFGGYHRSQVTCQICHARSNTFDFFMDFILDIRNAKSLEEALKRFTQPETLENENAYKCGKCRKKVTARKKFTVFKAPNVATFQLKRFDSDRIFGGKITKFISYPEELDLRPYMSDPTKSPIKYNLSAVLVHIGHSSNSGHYFCFIKNSNNFWYRMDDSSVSLVTQNTVLQQQAYVLFYNRKPGQAEPSPSLVTSQNIIKLNHNALYSSNNNKKKIENSTNNKEKIVRKSDLKHPSNGVAQEANSNSISNNTHNNNRNNHNHNNHNNSLNKNDTNNHNSHNSSKNNLSSNHNNSSSSNNTTNGSFTTWSGFKSRLDEDDSNKRKHDDARDKFNDELDQGKVKKIKSRLREDRFSYLSKTNHFQRFTNSYQQYNNNKRKIYNK